MIPDELVDRIRDAADIVQIVGEHVALKRMGTDFRGPCPFHQGTHRNFSVSPKKGIYYCFVCHEGGDVFTFLQKHLGLSWRDAVKMVAEKTGIEFREETRNREDGSDWRAPHWEMHAAAAAWCERQLWESPQGQPAREYLAGRGITRDVAERFGIGYAPRDAAGMRAHLESLGIGVERQLEGGLLVQREEGGAPRPRFRDRLMFPILDALGRHVGFGGRLLGPGEPKYLNSPETPVFSKGKLLYGLHWAKPAIRRAERILLVEGYFDVVRLAAAGIAEVVAPLGTALTEEQAAMIVRAASEVFLLYDSDAAGQKATFRAGLALLAQGATVRVVTLPDGDDPDTYVAAHGAAALEARLGEAVDLFERQVQLLEGRGWFADLPHKRQAIDKLLPTIRAASDPVMRDLYLGRLAEAAHVERGVLERELAAPTRRTSRGGPAPRRAAAADAAPWGDAPPAMPDEQGRPAYRGGTPRGERGSFGRRDGLRGRDGFGGRGRGRPGDTPGWRSAPGVPPPSPDAPRRERDLLRLLVHERRFVETVVERFDPAQLTGAGHRALFDALAADPEADVAALAERLDGEAVALLERLQGEAGEVGVPEDTLERSLAFFAKDRLERENAALQSQMAVASEDEKTDLLLRIVRNKREIESLLKLITRAPR